MTLSSVGAAWLALAGVFGDKAFRVENLAENHAGSVSLTGLLAVFTGLAVLCFFMIGLGKVFATLGSMNGVAAGDLGEGDSEAPAACPEETPPAEEEDEFDPEHHDPRALRMETFALAMLSRHLYDKHVLRLGEELVMKLENRKVKVRLMSAGGWYNTAMIDGERVRFTASNVAPDDDTGKKIIHDASA